MVAVCENCMGVTCVCSIDITILPTIGESYGIKTKKQGRVGTIKENCDNLKSELTVISGQKYRNNTRVKYETTSEECMLMAITIRDCGLASVKQLELVERLISNSLDHGKMAIIRSIHRSLSKKFLKKRSI